MFFQKIEKDIPASFVVFLVALPLCLGIAHASQMPIFSGVIAGIVGGIVVGIISGSHVSVSGPAAGLITLVITSKEQLKLMIAQPDATNILAVLSAVVVLAGVIQIALGALKLGKVADFIPVSVIKGMLAAIGILLILKQIPHLVGWDKDDFGDESFIQNDGENTFTELLNSFNHLGLMATLVGLLGIALLLLWDSKWIKKVKFLQMIPGPLVVVIVGILVNANAASLLNIDPIQSSHLVNLPNVLSDDNFSWVVPDFQFIGNIGFLIIVLKLATIASLESILSLEASDKIDPHKRVASPNRELIAQGSGNIVSGLLGGLPISAVIVRSSANVTAGAETKLSAVVHGIWLMLFVLFFPGILNMIPNASLAAVLIMVGYKLTKWELYQLEWKKGQSSFVPFVVTVLSILITDLLIGIVIGLVVGFYYVIKTNFHKSITMVSIERNHLIRFNHQATFMNKSIIKSTLQKVPEGDSVILDFTNCSFVDQDVLDVIEDYKLHATELDIKVIIKNNQQTVI